LIKRIILLLTVATLLVAMAAPVAFTEEGEPIDPEPPTELQGPNSYEPLYDKGGLTEGEFNYGNCQRIIAEQPPNSPFEEPGSAGDFAQESNPGVFTGPEKEDPNYQPAYILCTR